MMTQSQSAPITVSKDRETSMSTPIRAQPPIIVPAIMMSVGQLTRRGSASRGSSIEAAWAARCRTSGSKLRLPRRLRPSSGSSAGFCSCLSAPSIISGSRHRAAESAARPAPITTAVAAMALARSRSSRSGEARTEALRKSARTTVPVTGSTSTASPLIAP